MVGPTKQGMEDLIAQDPDAYWDTVNNKVVSTMNPSPRVVAIPLFDPYYYDTGKHERPQRRAQVVNYLGFFIEGMNGNEVIGRITPDRRPAHGRRPVRRRRPRSRNRSGWFSKKRPTGDGATDGFDHQSRRRLQAAGRAAAARVRRADRHPRRPARQRAAKPDIALVDIRADASSGMAAIERLRAAQPAMAIFAIAARRRARPDPPGDARRRERVLPVEPGGATPASRSMEESFHGAVRRTAARREAASAGARLPCVTHVFLGAKGGAGTTTVAVNCAVELARLTKRPTVIVDLKTCLGEVALFLGVRPRFTVLDAIENLHRLDKDFLKELVSQHKSGLDIIAGSEQFDRPNAQDVGAIEELLRILARTYDYVIVDAGNTINSCAVAALYAADTVFLVTNPDVPSIRNAQRLVERVRQLGAGSERVKILLNRVSEKC